jgi:hypothetical protein
MFLLCNGAAAVKPKKKKVPNGLVFGSPATVPGALRGTVYTTNLDYGMQPFGEEWIGIVCVARKSKSTASASSTTMAYTRFKPRKDPSASEPARTTFACLIFKAHNHT